MALGTALSAVGAGVLYLSKKQGTAKVSAEKDKASAPSRKAEKNGKTGSYSFVSGFKDAATVEVTLQYDPEVDSFAVVEDEFLAETSDSHVAVLYDPQVELQLEYAAYANGESFVDLIREVESRHSDFAPIDCGENNGICYREGDVLCLCFPAGDDPYSYLLITAMPGAENDDGVEALAQNKALIELLSTMKV